MRIGRRSACTAGVHQGEAAGEDGAAGKAMSFVLGTGGFREIALSGGTET
jgi:hypothetical protein